ncbi:MAG: DUF1080 domain-containing protein [Planctomycetota bacterium]|nr:DUF1080 domain-containing protein [Planctomycetota bacterium]
MIRYVATALLLVSALPAQGHVTPPEGFSPLLVGKGLTGWRGRPHLDPKKEAAMSPEKRAKQQAKWNADRDAHWRVENGEIVNDGKGVFLTTEKEYEDFEFTFEYKTVAKADSGVYLRYIPQVQIWDTTEAGGKWNLGADKGSGALWNNKRYANRPLHHADRPFGEWNSLRIRMVGSRVSVWMNDKFIVDDTILENYFDRKRPVPTRGAIQLQTHGGEIRWRNLFIREIGADEANRMLAKRASTAFESVFNGKDFSGWAGPTHTYEVDNGAIRCRAGAGGTIYTKATYDDFVARLEFKLPPGGNNGLAIRYPGSGDTAYIGMCELQVIDHTHKKYANLKDWQVHGSAYGMAPAHRGFLRPAGTWNFQEVTVKGSTITVELNGYVILETDLSKIDKPFSGNAHAGRTRTEGHFGFAGHNDPVSFRHVRIKRL